MLIGIDFDNTIVCYDAVFHRAALERGLIPQGLSAAKGAVRDYLRGQGKEDEWTLLQGYVYGARMLEACPFAGVMEFFTGCRDMGIDCCIISHRTEHPYAGPQYDLHAAARGWIDHYGFYESTGLVPEQVFLEHTLQQKLRLIAEQRCDVFIDDLPEFLTEPTFPRDVERILFDPNNIYGDNQDYKRVLSWRRMLPVVTAGLKVG